jgi:carbon monoxide dehydrogenase subunit G
MELQGSVILPAGSEPVWLALNNPNVLRLCIPGCEEVRQISPEEMHARVMLRLGPVRANFVGKVLMTDVRPLQGCTLNFEGSGGSAGFARGSSAIVLTAVPEGTRLDYTAQASVAGKLGQIGGRLMDASAKQLADRFFAAFKSHITAGDSAIPLIPSTSATAAAAAAPIAGIGSTEPGTPEAWFEREKPRLLWFIAGVASTALGVWMGAHWLR